MKTSLSYTAIFPDNIHHLDLESSILLLYIILQSNVKTLLVGRICKLQLCKFLKDGSHYKDRSYIDLLGREPYLKIFQGGSPTDLRKLINLNSPTPNPTIPQRAYT